MSQLIYVLDDVNYTENLILTVLLLAHFTRDNLKIYSISIGASYCGVALVHSVFILCHFDVSKHDFCTSSYISSIKSFSTLAGEFEAIVRAACCTGDLVIAAMCLNTVSLYHFFSLESKF